MSFLIASFDLVWRILETLLASRTVLLLVVLLISIFLPTFLGWARTTILQNTAMRDYPIYFGSIHLGLYFSLLPYMDMDAPQCWW